MRTADCLEVWGRDPERLRVRDTVSGIIQEYLFWPNRVYLPEDPCEILFFDPTVDLRNAEAWLVLEDTFHLPPDYTMGKNQYTWTLGKLIDRILSNVRATGRTFTQGESFAQWIDDDARRRLGVEVGAFLGH